MPPKRKTPLKPAFEKDRKPAKPLWPPGPISSNCPYQWDEYYRRYGEAYAKWEEELDEWKALYGGDTDSEDESEAEGVATDNQHLPEGHHMQDVLEDRLAEAINSPLLRPPMTHEEFLQTL